MCNDNLLSVFAVAYSEMVQAGTVALHLYPGVWERYISLPEEERGDVSEFIAFWGQVIQTIEIDGQTYLLDVYGRIKVLLSPETVNPQAVIDAVMDEIAKFDLDETWLQEGVKKDGVITVKTADVLPLVKRVDKLARFITGVDSLWLRCPKCACEDIAIVDEEIDERFGMCESCGHQWAFYPKCFG